jgi:hypothetical protein
MLDLDLNNIVYICRNGSRLIWKAFWLSVDDADQAAGYLQRFSLPIALCQRALQGETVRCLAYMPETRPKAELCFTTEAYQAIRSICKNPRAKNALRKFFRDNFNYGDESLLITRDSFTRGFFFSSLITSYAGGIVPHESQVRGKNGRIYPRICFGLHT